MGEAPDPYPLVVDWCDRCDTAQVRIYGRNRCIWCGERMQGMQHGQEVAPEWWWATVRSEDG